MERFGVKARGPQALARSLSGGNLQKYVVGRENYAAPRVLIVSQPTWGVDVGAAAQIRAELLALRDAGTALLIVSEELDELMELSDALVVMAKGHLSPRIARREATRSLIGEWMSGLWGAEGQRARGRPMLKLERRPEPSRVLAFTSPLLALALTLAVGFALFVALGKDPLRGLTLFFYEPLKNERALAELSIKACPLLLIALGLSLCFRANVWNIGAEGQFIFGALGGTAVALRASPSSSPCAVVGRVLVGGTLRARRGPASPALLARSLSRERNFGELDARLRGGASAELRRAWPVERPERLQFPPNSRVFVGGPGAPPRGGVARHLGAPLLRSSRWCSGSSLTAPTWVTGWRWPGWRRARHATRASRRGARCGRRCWCGAMAGLAGALEVSGPVGQLTTQVPVGYGFAAIIVAFVGRLSPLGVTFSSVLLSMFYLGGELSQSRLGLPKSITGVFQGLLLFSVLGCDTFDRPPARLPRLATPRAEAS